MCMNVHIEARTDEKISTKKSDYRYLHFQDNRKEDYGMCIPLRKKCRSESVIDCSQSSFAKKEVILILKISNN